MFIHAPGKVAAPRWAPVPRPQRPTQTDGEHPKPRTPSFPSLPLLMLRPAFVPLLPLSQGGSDPATPPCQRTTAPPSHVHPCVRPSCRESLPCREATPHFSWCGYPVRQHRRLVVSRPPAAMFWDKPQQPSTSPLSSRLTPSNLVDAVRDVGKTLAFLFHVLFILVDFDHQYHLSTLLLDLSISIVYT